MYKGIREFYQSLGKSNQELFESGEQEVLEKHFEELEQKRLKQLEQLMYEHIPLKKYKVEIHSDRYGDLCAYAILEIPNSHRKTRVSPKWYSEYYFGKIFEGLKCYSKLFPEKTPQEIVSWYLEQFKEELE